jgi:hypothetical protein
LIRAWYAAGMKTEASHVRSYLGDHPCRSVVRTAGLDTKLRGS